MATRSRKGQPQNRRDKVTTQNERALTRKFVLNEIVSLNTSQGSNTILERTIQWDGAELQGFSAISSNWDQYRIKRIQVFLTSCSAPVTQLQIPLSIARQPLYANASTTVYSAVDVTGGPNPGVDIQAYQNVEFRQVHPWNATKVADFEPRIDQSSGLLYTPSTWVSTSNPTQIWNALHLRIVNSRGTNVWTSPTTPQEYNVRSVVHVEFRHPIYDQQTLFARSQVIARPLVARDETAVRDLVTTSSGVPDAESVSLN